MLFCPKPLEPGTPAPPIRCTDDRGEPFDLDSLRGTSVVLVFYPADNTPTCTTQLCELRDAYSDVEKAGAVVLGVNSFKAESHAGFRARHGFPFRLLADHRKQVAKLYHAAGLFVVRRTVYVIDGEGVVRYAKRGKPPVSEILAALPPAGG